MLGLIAASLALGVCIAVIARGGFSTTKQATDASVGSWGEVAKGFLAVATPCCQVASIWDSLDTVSPDDQRARPATLEEAAQWLNVWPYRDRNDENTDDEELRVGAQGSEVRCYGSREDDGVPNDADDEVVLKRLELDHSCVYLKWKAWTAPSDDGHQRERHWVGVDSEGFFRGSVEHWRPD